MNIFKFTGMFMLLVAAVACTKQDGSGDSSASADVTADTSAEVGPSYEFGLLMGSQLKSAAAVVDYDEFLKGVKASHQGEAGPKDIREAQSKVGMYVQKQQAARSKRTEAEGKAFLAENGKREGVVTTESGLQYEVLREGSGEKRPTEDDRVTVHYRGTLLDGTVFDESYESGEPVAFNITSVVPGWREGLQLMNEGAKYKFYIPHELAYGPRGAGASIGPYSTLIFEIELVSWKPKF